MEKQKVEKKIQRTFTGTVVSTKMNKTIVVKVDTIKVHPIYAKRFITHKRYLVHDEKGVAKVGEVVHFVECRPLSKTKRWRLAVV